ncbi:FAD-dependent monooxygenase [Nocardia flavorosea]|uniref:FAD-dependent monooxygenase n=1 Tax=Nocardia flavorosea TaxID=53429 RepID=UPI0018946DF9|nr:FAD-dependent monooxygenase [Nocardia flavorosea]MBF6351615.1 FAD-dependent monooxygenase [Nocardia flavorosea]
MDILISGAGVAGPVLAYWLQRYGYTPVVVEHTPRPRLGLGGHAVDLFAPASEVMDRMGLLPRLQAARVETSALRYELPGGSSIDVDLRDISEAFADDRHLEIMRGDLATILQDATADRVEYRFGDSIAALAEDAAGIDVTFDSGRTGRFDLVLGADGLHSAVRRLIFGPEDELSHHLGGYLAVGTLPNYRELTTHTVLYNAVDRIAAMYPVAQTGQARAVFLFRHPTELVYDHRDIDAQRRLLRTEYRNEGWEIPRLLDEMDRADDFYLDAISQIRMDSWSRGRVSLVGDAGYAPGPAVGGGTTLAVVGAYLLARALAEAGGAHQQAFTVYERQLRDYVRRCREAAPGVLRRGIPRSRAHLRFNALATRLLTRMPAALRTRLLAGGASSALSSFALPDEAAPPELDAQKRVG